MHVIRVRERILELQPISQKVRSSSIDYTRSSIVGLQVPHSAWFQVNWFLGVKRLSKTYTVIGCATNVCIHL